MWQVAVVLSIFVLCIAPPCVEHMCGMRCETTTTTTTTMNCTCGIG